MEKFSQEQNKLKYEREGKDLISDWADISPKIAVIACITKVQGYFRRYDSQAEKAKNETDILKSMDYLQRAKAIMPKTHHAYPYLSQLEDSIKNLQFSRIDNLCYQVLATIII